MSSRLWVRAQAVGAGEASPNSDEGREGRPFDVVYIGLVPFSGPNDPSERYASCKTMLSLATREILRHSTIRVHPHDRRARQRWRRENFVGKKSIPKSAARHTTKLGNQVLSTARALQHPGSLTACAYCKSLAHAPHTLADGQDGTAMASFGVQDRRDLQAETINNAYSVKFTLTTLALPVKFSTYTH